MRIDKLHVKGFRNFSDETIVFQPKTLIIGANDVGKTNLLYCLRILFDKSLSDRDLELLDSDYNAYSKADYIEITAELSDVTEDCLISTFAGALKDNRVLIRYCKRKNEPFAFYVGSEESLLSEISGRSYYIRRVNMQCVDTNRDLFSFLKRERIQLLKLSKERLSKEEQAEDSDSVTGIQNDLDTINGKVNSLHYVSSALTKVNQELSELSIHNEDQSIRFIAGESDAAKLLDNLILSYSTDTNPLSLGGDGRNNQIFMAAWIAKQEIEKNVDHVTFYAIEEPEAHLHPHQQRKLSDYIQNHFQGQIFITSHSPQIASKFIPKNIVRLFSKNKYSYAACGGCSELLEKALHDFGYRLNALSSEVFFADGVFLVEGTSEVLFYSSLADELDFDLDRSNISVLSVDGIGFFPYIAVCSALSIPWAVRTDNDIFSKSQGPFTVKYYAGISRAMDIFQAISDKNEPLLQYWTTHIGENEWQADADIPSEASLLNDLIRGEICKHGIFLAEKDLETDLANSSVQEDLLSFYNEESLPALIHSMKKRKATNMFSFLHEKNDSLKKLADSNLVLPLTYLQTRVEEGMHPNGDKDSNSRAETGDRLQW